MQLNQVRQPFCQNCQILLITSVIWQINVIVWFHLCPPRIIVGPMHAECDHTVIIFKDFCCSISLMDIKVNDEDWWLNIAKVRIIPQWHRWSNSNVIEHTWTQVKDPRCLQFSSWCLQIQDDEFCFPLTFSINWWRMYTSVVTSTWMKKFGNSFKDNRRKATRYFLQKPSPWPAKAWWVPPAILAATILLEPCITACIAATVPPVEARERSTSAGLHGKPTARCCWWSSIPIKILCTYSWSWTKQRSSSEANGAGCVVRMLRSCKSPSSNNLVARYLQNA